MTVATTPSATHTEQQAAPYGVQLDLDKPSDDTCRLAWVSGDVNGMGWGLPVSVGIVEVRGRLEFSPQLELDTLTKWQNTHACLLSSKLGGLCYEKRHAGALELLLPNSKLKTPLSSWGHCRESGASMDAWEQGGCQILWHSHGAPLWSAPCSSALCKCQVLKNDCRLCDLNSLVTPSPAVVADEKAFCGKSTELMALGVHLRTWKWTLPFIS